MCGNSLLLPRHNRSVECSFPSFKQCTVYNSKKSNSNAYRIYYPGFVLFCSFKCICNDYIRRVYIRLVLNPLFLELYTPLLLHQITGNLIFQCSNIHTHTHLCTLHTLLFLLSSFSFYRLISISLTSI